MLLVLFRCYGGTIPTSNSRTSVSVLSGTIPIYSGHLSVGVKWTCVGGLVRVASGYSRCS